ncbi:MAG: prepilin peptidase [Terracidiphilus sp.]|jgi:prepilin peptidase CpaA
MHRIVIWLTLVVLAIATFTDLRSRRIPNWLVLPYLLAGVAISPWRSDWHGVRLGFWHGLGQSCAGVALGFLIYGLLFWMGGMGAGDVKLCAAIGAWIGPVQSFWAMFFTAIAGGMVVLCWVAYIKGIKKLVKMIRRLVSSRGEQSVESEPEASLSGMLTRKMPYAPAIAIGTLLSFFAG